MGVRYGVTIISLDNRSLYIDNLNSQELNGYLDLLSILASYKIIKEYSYNEMEGGL